MIGNANETVQVDDGAVVHTSESELPSHAETHHVLSEEAQATVDKIQSILTANFDRKLAGSSLTAEMYNKMNDMFVKAHNQHDVSVEALKQYILQFLPNFVDVYLSDDINEANPLVGTISDGLLVIDLRSALSTMLGSVYQNSVAYIEKRLEGSNSPLVSLTKAEIDTLIAGGSISDDYSEEFLAEEITNSEIDNIFNS